MSAWIIDTVKERFPDWEHFQFDYGRWTCTHRDYDVSYEGEEDGYVDNGLKAEGRTLEELVQDIESVIEEHDL